MDRVLGTARTSYEGAMLFSGDACNRMVFGSDLAGSMACSEMAKVSWSRALENVLLRTSDVAESVFGN